MSVLQREDIAPGAAKVALTGQRCTEWPPLQVDPRTGFPTMEDRDTLGARIEQQGPFHSYYITWPGSRLPIDDPKEVRVLCVISFSFFSSGTLCSACLVCNFVFCEDGLSYCFIVLGDGLLVL